MVSSEAPQQGGHAEEHDKNKQDKQAEERQLHGGPLQKPGVHSAANMGHSLDKIAVVGV